MRRRSHVSAADVLPAELVQRLREALGDRPGYVWVPSRSEEKRTARNRYILRLYGDGVRVPEIATRLFLSERWIWEILAKARAASAPSDHAATRTRCSNH